MSKLKELPKSIYIGIVIILFYLPLFFIVVFSFNQTSDKGFVIFSWSGFTFDAYRDLFSSPIMLSFVNSILLGLTTSAFVIILSLLTVFSIWKTKNRVVKVTHQVTNNVLMINPDIIIGASLALFLSLAFGVLASNNEGFLRAILGHTIMCLPYGILIMYPRSEKFQKNLFDASKDLGFSSFKTWFKTYFVFMMSAIIFTFVVTMILSFDDFIITSITSNMETVGTQLYQGHFKSWAMALGSILVITLITVNVSIFLYNFLKTKKKVK